MKAILAIDYRDIKQWRGKTKEFHDFLERASRIAGPAVNQFATSCDCIITNAYGRAALTFLVWEGSFNLWNYNTGASIGVYPDILPDNELEEIVEKVTAGLNYCGVCKKWFPLDQMKQYSYAGTVCHKCYNPAVHLPPDTRGE